VSVLDEVRAFLADHPATDGDDAAFREAATDAGWLAPTWSSAWYGRELGSRDAAVVGEEFVRAGRSGRADLRHLHARIVYSMGTDELKQTYLRGLLSGEMSGCLLYSEPDAGSDLGSLRTRAVRDGDSWRVDGQKVWTSDAGRADFGLLAARTNTEVPKHEGITFFVLPMGQGGVRVEPIVQITGDRHFNEVFLTGAVVPDSYRLSDVDAGWPVLMGALGMERSVMGDRGLGSRAADPEFVGTDDDLLALARRHGRSSDPATLTQLAGIYGARAAARLNSARYAEEGRAQDPAAMSMSKLAMSELLHRTAALRREVVGAASLLDEPGGDGARVNFFTLDAYFTSIGGGTDQIQRNIIAERILGMPKEDDPSRSIPFSQVRR
jgi:alkylation response protein AidB-like acyl-CoA dehydrogenase